MSRVLCDNRLQGKIFTELELKLLMCQLIHGLQYIHSHDLAHLDLKPDNIFLSIDKSNSFMQDSFCEGLEDEGLSPIIYKIGLLYSISHQYGCPSEIVNLISCCSVNSCAIKKIGRDVWVSRDLCNEQSLTQLLFQ